MLRLACPTQVQSHLNHFFDAHFELQNVILAISICLNVSSCCCVIGCSYVMCIIWLLQMSEKTRTHGPHSESLGYILLDIHGPVINHFYPDKYGNYLNHLSLTWTDMLDCSHHHHLKNTRVQSLGKSIWSKLELWWQAVAKHILFCLFI